MRCLLPAGIRVAEGWRGTSFPYIQKQFATLVSRQQDILICLYAVEQSLAAQCLSELFLMPAPRAGWGDTRLSSGVLCGGPCSADNSLHHVPRCSALPLHRPTSAVWAGSCGEGDAVPASVYPGSNGIAG